MIDNKGDKTFETDTEVKSISEITGQVSNVNKSLLSVSEIVEIGNRVVLDKGGSYIENTKTSNCLELKEWEACTF